MTAKRKRREALRQPLMERTHAQKEAMALGPLIDDVQDSLDRFLVLYEEGGNIDAAMIDLQINVDCLSDGVDKNGGGE